MTDQPQLAHPGDPFLTRIRKRHVPPFDLDRSPRRDAIGQWRLLDGRGAVVARFSRWRWAVLAYQALCRRHGELAATEATLKRHVRQTSWDRVKAREDAVRNKNLFT